MNKRYFLLVGLSFLLFINSFGQGLVCEQSEPFCTGSIYTFPAGTTGSAQPGAFYGCLSSQPAPAWYHMLIEDPGPITIYMFSTPLVDIDFICWGPFTDPYVPCVEGLTASTVIDCSYSPNPTEYCDIPAGITGQYYILLITNYSQQPCEITFSQTGGTGSTDCTILPPPVGNNGPLCVGDTLHLYAETIPNASYWWSGPNGFLSTQQNPTILNVSLVNAGNYQCVITVNGQSSDPALTSVVVYSLPTANLLSEDTAVCIGDAVYAIFGFSGWGPYKITYNDGTNTYLSDNLYSPQDTIFLFPTTPTTYTFTKVQDLHCEHNMLFTMIEANTFPACNGTLSGSGTMCAGEPAQLVFNLNGSPPWNITYTINGGSPQIVAANASPYIETVYPTTTTIYAFSDLEDINCQGDVSGEAVVSVDPSPISNAGNDVSIAYGTTTTLNGQASGGSGNYAYAWQPAAKLTNPNVQQPTTVNLMETTLFTLTATDNVGGCFDADEVLVTITGGPLGCFPTADPPAVCNGQSSQLQSMASGGSGEYTYQWSSTPAGFSSTLPNPVVTPMQNTSYHVQINDGYNLISGDVTIYLRPLPLPEAGNDITIPHGTIATLQGSASSGSGSFVYHWEPADKLVNPNTPNPQTINLYATTLFSLYVSDATYGCNSEAPDQMSVVISGDALAANPSAVPDEICVGESTQLFALAGGGSGNYTYTWSSDNGFTSEEPNPVTTPPSTGSYTYTCTVNDGFNTTEGSVAINVRAAPMIEFGFADTVICVYDTVTLDAGNAGSTYIWSNGSAEKTIDVATTGIGFDMQTYTVSVTNQSGCTGEKTVTVVFDFSACTGIDDNVSSNFFRIYPNPGDGSLHLSVNQGIKEVTINIKDIIGKNVWGPYQYSESEVNREIRIDLGDKPEGIYFIQVINDESNVNTIKYILKR